MRTTHLNAYTQSQEPDTEWQYSLTTRLFIPIGFKNPQKMKINENVVVVEVAYLKAPLQWDIYRELGIFGVQNSTGISRSGWNRGPRTDNSQCIVNPLHLENSLKQPSLPRENQL